ncbi:MAG TPA: UDP-2,3-diacylglucosamine diphosphatase [Chiayiivirga sp.]|nr:UDP-2,3-diacylglucosamine diphosphatase [Chiayiivirga sp.]
MAHTAGHDVAVCALLVSDLHLDPSRPRITELFLKFLRDEATRVAELHILGDLFEAWIGDDDDAPLATAVAKGLASVAETGTRITFIRGNRDFLLGQRFAQRAGFSILHDPSVVMLAGEAVLLLHGDVLCWDDSAYQAVRRQVRDPRWQTCLLARPLDERRAFAAHARASSAAHQSAMSSLDVGDASDEAVHAYFRRFGVRRMIHGHTHRPAIHDLRVDDLPRQRVVLGDWYEQGSVLRVRADGRLELDGLSLDSTQTASCERP